MGAVEGARSYHLTHRSGWRDPLRETGWEAAFYAAHPIAAVKLLAVFWASLSPASALPAAEARIGSLPALEAAARGDNGVDYDAARARLGLPACLGRAGGFGSRERVRRIAIEALVDPAEQPGLIAAAEQLSACLGAAAGGQPWPVRLNFREPGDGCPGRGRAHPDRRLPAARGRARRADRRDRGALARPRAGAGCMAAGAPVFVCTVFRHVADRAERQTSPALLERIRRLNRLAVSLSHELDIGVIDIDRAMAHIGGGVLQTDYRQSGVLAAEVAGHTLAWGLLSFGLDDAIDPEVQEKAKAILGGLQQIDAWSARLAPRPAPVPSPPVDSRPWTPPCCAG